MMFVLPEADVLVEMSLVIEMSEVIEMRLVVEILFHGLFPKELNSQKL